MLVALLALSGARLSPSVGWVRGTLQRRQLVGPDCEPSVQGLVGSHSFVGRDLVLSPRSQKPSLG